MEFVLKTSNMIFFQTSLHPLRNMGGYLDSMRDARCSMLVWLMVAILDLGCHLGFWLPFWIYYEFNIVVLVSAIKTTPHLLECGIWVVSYSLLCEALEPVLLQKGAISQCHFPINTKCWYMKLIIMSGCADLYKVSFWRREMVLSDS